MGKNILAAAAIYLASMSFSNVDASISPVPDGSRADAGASKVSVSISIKSLAFNSNGNADVVASDGVAETRASAGAVSVAGSNGDEGASDSVAAKGDEAAASGAAGVYVTTSDDTCMGSSGVGGQGDAFGFSIGSTWTDSNCIMLKNARELQAQGHHKAARARLCMNEDNAMAFELAGQPCPRQLASTQAVLAKLRAIDPDYAAAEPGPQLAALGDAGRIATSAKEAPRTDTLLAMMQSFVQNVAGAFATPAAGLADAYPYDGLE
jgi:hypothetical protein